MFLLLHPTFVFSLSSLVSSLVSSLSSELTAELELVLTTELEPELVTVRMTLSYGVVRIIGVNV